MASKQFHSRGIPLLIDAYVLRSRGAGQVDLARLENSKVITLVEVKWGRDELQSFKIEQLTRLKKSAAILAYFLGLNVQGEYWSLSEGGLAKKRKVF